MAFGGVPAFALVQESLHGVNIINFTGATLAANVGAFDATGAAADSGLLNSNNGAIDAVPANTSSLPVNFGPGQDNWTQEHVDALTVLLNDQGATASELSYVLLLIANVNPAPAGSGLTNNNVRIGVHNSAAALAAGAITAKLWNIHSIVK